MIPELIEARNFIKMRLDEMEREARNFIKMRLDEMEREELFRMKRVKGKSEK